MITYELAKKLKDARLSQFGRSRNFYIQGSLQENPVIATSEDIYIPTLSELIAACGDGFQMLIDTTPDDTHKWEAGQWEWCDGYSMRIDESRPLGSGSTPLEACANLYLALHPNN